MRGPVQRPTPAQIRAADPDVSAWVGANAGSGKTRVLTQRVARLLLAGADPGRILCLTYTKAAAAEMQQRLFATLGDWAMAPDAWLAEQLGALAGAPPIADPARLAGARRLFARALETPGGLKIQTIHAFCDALLRRFPLEAGVSTGFRVPEDRAAAQMRARLRQDMAAAAEAGDDPAFDRLAEVLADGDLAALFDRVLGLGRAFPGDPVEPRLRAHFDARALMPPREMATSALAGLDWPRLLRLAAALRAGGGKADTTLADALTRAREDAETGLPALIAALLTQKGEPRSTKGFPKLSVLAALPDAADQVAALQICALDWADLTQARRNVERAARLDAFATAALARYRAAKTAGALLDYDDLIVRAAGLLTTSEMAQWVLWKLDQGLDHILVDEAQDTAPGQWAVIDALAAEFHAGVGARDPGRTLFVVGDEKQSIYSFQGADPRSFGDTRDRIARRLGDMGLTLDRPDLVTSFRSAPGILDFVDAVFQGAHGLTRADVPVRHAAHRAGDAARVALWPLVPALKVEPDPDWDRAVRPVDAAQPGAAKERLAAILGAEIARMLRGDRLPDRGGVPGRPVRPGDILVLVTKRDALMRGLIRALKAHGVPVAGADRMRLGTEIAVQDLVALMNVATCPDDDLSLAALLRSPLCETDETGLFALAHGRPGTLLRALRDRGGRDADMVADMAARADYLRPYEFLERALIHHDGRRRLIARLGVEAEDAIDELLAESLRFETARPPTLTGFIAWLGAGDTLVRREMDQASDAVRVMTVHGAKGLEAPVVILPDTMSVREGRGPGPIPIGGGAKPPLVLWPGPREADDRVTAAARDDHDAAAADERLRLLYVALTRAEDWLILCGAGEPARVEGTWYDRLATAMARLGGVETPAPAGLEGPVLLLGAPAAQAELAPETAPTAAPLPEWVSSAPVETRAAQRGASGLGPHLAQGGAGLGRAAAMLRGEAVHLVLERLTQPDPGRAARLVAQQLPDLDPGLAAEAVAEAMAVLAAPWAAALFAPGTLAEVTVALRPDLGGIGRIDRLVPGPDGVLIVDFKTDVRVPDAPGSVPLAYLAQLGAYAAALAPLDLGPVRTAIVWTRAPRLMPIPTDLGAQALAQALAASGGDA